MSAAVIVLGLAFLLVACLLGLVIVGAEEACHEWRERALAAERDREELQAREVMLLDDLDQNWEVLAEAIQTVIRAEVVAGRSTISDPYALLKELTRGHRVGGAELAEFVEKLEIGDAAKQRLLALTPATYTGIAERLAR